MPLRDIFRYGKNCDPVLLSCDNPLCSQPLDDPFVQYSPAFREIYHANGECAQNATIAKCMETGSATINNFRLISRKKAERLYMKGRLRQAQETTDFEIIE